MTRLPKTMPHRVATATACGSRNEPHKRQLGQAQLGLGVGQRESGLGLGDNMS